MASMKRHKKKTKRPVLQPFDKYRYYIDSVQAPDIDAKFFLEVYEELRGKKPQSLREDFCGTFIVCCEWVKLNPSFKAYGLDLDPEPVDWGKRNNLFLLKPEQQNRVSISLKNVLDKDVPNTDIVAAQNFSFFLFKKRQQMKEYFQNVYNSLNTNGIFITDCFGGSGCYEPNEEETKYKTYSYFWDQDTFDPITMEGMFYIHFKRKGEKKREKVFTYDWRLWSIPELKEIMFEVGFKDVQIYWEGTKKDGSGDGNFKIAKVGEPCDSWISYIVGIK